MKCYICNKDLTDDEIVIDNDTKEYAPCSECMAIILDAAYSDGFVKPDEEEIEPVEETFFKGYYEDVQDSYKTEDEEYD